MAIKKTTISRADAYKAGSWIETNWENLKTLTREQAAKSLGEHLGMPGVNANHIARIVRDMGREWPGIRQHPARGAGVQSHRSRFFARQIVLLERQVRRLFTAMADLGVARDPKLELDIERLLEMSKSAPEAGTNGHVRQTALPLK